MQKLTDNIFGRNTPGINKKIKNHVIGIAGCGGLGSNAAVMLTRAGITNFVLVDCDKVEMSNLNRQHYFQEDVGKTKTHALDKILKKINPNINIKIINKRLSGSDISEVFFNCTIIIEAFDSVESKSMIVKAFGNKQLSCKYLIGASGVAGIGAANSIQTQQIAKNIFICGDFITESNPVNGLMATRVMIVAGHQANKVLEIIDSVEDD